MNFRPKIKVSYNEDIRRVPMISNEFNLLQKQVRELFEFTGHFVMKYKDDEGDMISICTEEELKEAMQNLENGILRLFVHKKENRTPKRKCKRNKSPQQVNKEKIDEEDINPFLRDLIPEAEEIEEMINHLPETIHNFYQGEIKDTIKEFCPYLFEMNFFNSDKPSTNPKNNEEIISGNIANEDQPNKIIHNAFCDRCDEKIVGLRFKCFDCEDFDLCEDCQKVVEGKEDIKTHLKTHRFGKMENIFSFGFQQEREEHLSLLKLEKEKKEQQEKERIEKEKKEKEKQEKLEKEKKEQQEKERFEKEQQEKERSFLLAANESKTIPFDQKLDILFEMGFSDRKKNIQVLIKHKGNLNSAIQDLINL